MKGGSFSRGSGRREMSVASFAQREAAIASKAKETSVFAKDMLFLTQLLNGRFDASPPSHNAELAELSLDSRLCHGSPARFAS